MNKPQKKESAFTLVEMAIVLVIVGLLIGGVLAGQELINQAKMASQISEWEKLKTAVHAYKLKTNNLPGDDPKASVFFSGATNGNGNKSIGAPTHTFGYDYASPAESCHMFDHLEKAKLFPFKLGATCNAFAGLTGGVNAPRLLNTNNWWFVISEISSVEAYNASPTYTGKHLICTATVRISNPWITFINNHPAVQLAPLTGEQAFYIDLKIDDGKPHTGNSITIAGDSSSGTLTKNCSQNFDKIPAGSYCVTSGLEYDTSSKYCALSIQAGF